MGVSIQKSIFQITNLFPKVSTRNYIFLGLFFTSFCFLLAFLWFWSSLYLFSIWSFFWRSYLFYTIFCRPFLPTVLAMNSLFIISIIFISSWFFLFLFPSSIKFPSLILLPFLYQSKFFISLFFNFSSSLTHFNQFLVIYHKINYVRTYYHFTCIMHLFLVWIYKNVQITITFST